MTIELIAGQSKELNVALTPIPVTGGLVISKLFIGTNSWDFKDNAEDRAYVELENRGAQPISGTVMLYHWEEHWGDPPGDDQLEVKQDFTLAPGEYWRYHNLMWHRKFETAYIRLVVTVNNVVVLETPYIYFVPGKQNIGGSEEAVGECIYTTPGLAVLWYGQNRSSCKSWHGFYKTPPLGEADHRGSFDVDTFNGESWNAVFLVMLDPGFISGAEYRSEISGGPHWTQAWFNFIAG